MKTKTKKILAVLILLIAIVFLAVCLGCHLATGWVLLAYALLIIAGLTSAIILITIK